jgi:hypothetical protein
MLILKKFKKQNKLFQCIFLKNYFENNHYQNNKYALNQCFEFAFYRFNYHLNHLKVYYCHKVSQTLKSHTRLQCFKINLGVMVAIVSSRFNLGVMVIIV